MDRYSSNAIAGLPLQEGLPDSAFFAAHQGDTKGFGVSLGIHVSALLELGEKHHKAKFLTLTEGSATFWSHFKCLQRGALLFTND